VFDLPVIITLLVIGTVQQPGTGGPKLSPATPCLHHRNGTVSALDSTECWRGWPVF